MTGTKGFKNPKNQSQDQIRGSIENKKEKKNKKWVPFYVVGF